ncbi:MAG: zf-HC2 domain-containing protein, partial [Planctomycetota bacterium]
MSEGAADVSCNEAREDLSALIDAALPRERQATLEEHLASCGACREEHAALLAVAKQVRSLPPVSAPPDFVATLFARLDGGDASVAEAPAAAEPRNRATPARPAGEPGAKPCEALAEDLSALLDRHLEGEAAALARRHLAECAACRERQAAWQRVRDRVGALPPLRAPADFLERVWAQIESLEEERRLAQRRRLEARSAFWSGAVRLGRAAAVLLAIGGGFWLAAPGDGARLSLVSSFGPAAQRLAPNSERPRAQRTRRGAPPPAPAEQ